MIRMPLVWFQQDNGKIQPRFEKLSTHVHAPSRQTNAPARSLQSFVCPIRQFCFPLSGPRPFGGQPSVCVRLCFSLHRSAPVFFFFKKKSVCLPLLPVSLFVSIRLCQFFPSVCRLVFMFLGLTEVNRLPRWKESVKHLGLRSQTFSKRGYSVGSGLPKAI